MVEIHSVDYDGPERRRSLIIGQCGCHLKHEAAIQSHTNDLKVMEKEMKTKISWKLFSLFVSIVVISTAFIYNEIRATSNHSEQKIEAMDERIEERMDNVDKNLQVTIVREEMFRENTNLTLRELKNVVNRIDENVHRHLEEVRQINGNRQLGSRPPRKEN